MQKNETKAWVLKSYGKAHEAFELKPISLKKLAENDLDLLQKKTQFELIGNIVRISLFVIIGVGITTTGVYMVALFSGKDTEIIASTWSNMFGILLTNSFSIIGTIMGVKYAASSKKEEGN